MLAFMLCFSENKEQSVQVESFKKFPWEQEKVLICRKANSLVLLCLAADVLNISDAQNIQIKNIQLIWDQHLVSVLTKEQHKGTQGQNTTTFLAAYPDCETVSRLNLASPNASIPVNTKGRAPIKPNKPPGNSDKKVLI